MSGFKGKQENSSDLYIGFSPVKVNSVTFEEKGDLKLVTIQVREPNNKFFINQGFIVFPEIATSQTGKTQYIDEQGRTKWAVDKASLDSTEYFDATTARPAVKGEEEITGFIASLANVEKGGAARFSDFMAIANGNLTEIQDILKQFPNNKVGVAIGVRNGKYLTFYTKKTVKGWSKNGNYIKKEIEKDTRNKDYYGTDFEKLNLFDPASIKPNDGLPDEEVTLPEGDTIEGAFGDTSHIKVENPADYDSLPF